uniref:Selectin E n=1 Tax=Syphacia muris TaxID=451379 RepID=A0A158R628_9BILA
MLWSNAVLLASWWLIAVAAARHCSQPDVPENCHVILGQAAPFPPSTIAKYNCALGYQLIGTNERICLKNGSWSDVAPICAIDIAYSKPTEQSSGSSGHNAVSHNLLCALTDHSKSSWWKVQLHGSYSVDAVSVQLGELSSDIDSIELISSEHHQVTRCPVTKRVSGSVSAANISLNHLQIFRCSGKNISSVRLRTLSRLHLCHFSVFSVKAVSSWQCGQPSMEFLTVHNDLCYTASRLETLHWKAAQNRCLSLGGTLPLRVSTDTNAVIRHALSNSLLKSSFYWLGLMRAHDQWRWADGDLLDPKLQDWAEEPAENKGEATAAVFSRPESWHWVSMPQSIYNSWICQTKPKFCASPGVSEYGRVSFSSQTYIVGTICYYSCDEGFKLEGVARRECLSTGLWSNEVPVCKKVDCGPLSEWPDGTTLLLNGTTTYGSVAEYRCRKGRVISELSPSQRTCESDSQWSSVIPFCTDVDCGKPPEVANGNVIFLTTTLNSSANYSCSSAFKLIGHRKIRCADNGQWQPLAPVCYDMEMLREMKDSSGESNVILAIVVVFLLLLLTVLAFRLTRRRLSPLAIHAIDDTKHSSPRPLVYATPSQQQDSVIYYASTGPAPMTQVEVPPQLLQLQQLPNGNIHVTLPNLRPVIRPTLPTSMLQSTDIIETAAKCTDTASVSPTPSQLLYSFDDDPVYDSPPEDNVYEELAQTDHLQ